ncbi:hypothetical protein G9A89_023064 [Geosiphon pyriformis]|nr:hypothetical protein G9A89_023064 [Geosiphon pyriformis]
MCDLIYNLPPYIIYTISEDKKPISNCVLKSESSFKSDLNSNNNDKNNGFSSVQNDNNSNNNSNSNSNSEQYITLPDLSKEQKLKWFSNNDKSIMSE